MDFVLVFPLILALLATGQSDTELNSCFVLCPPGYHKVGSCDDPDAKHRCGKCDHNTFTEIENSTPKCRRCDACDHYEVEIKPCVFNSNVVCDCKEGYYYKGSDPNRRHCQQCPCESPFSKEASNKRECDCGSCLSDPQCKRKCVGCTILSPTNATTAPSATPVPSIEATSTESMSPKNLSPWLFFLLVVVAFLVLFWLLLHFTEKSVRYPDSCPCWGANKDPELPAEDPKCNEQGSHQDSTPTTMISNTSEGTPMLNPSPAKPEYPAHITPLLPGAEHRAVKQDEQSEQWPAIVLYTIIKEVPLRRWKEFLRLLSVADQQLERVELEAGLGQGSMERQYQMLRLWSQCSSASLSDVFSALHHMDLSGCAQLLQESLEKLQWWPELEQGFTDHGSNGSTQYT